MTPRRPVYLPRYALIVLITLATLGPVGSVYASIAISNHNTRRLVAEQQAAAREAQRQVEIARQVVERQSRDLVCAYFSANLDAYEETPPTTPAGINLRKVNLDFYNATGCKPPRK